MLSAVNTLLEADDLIKISIIDDYIINCHNQFKKQFLSSIALLYSLNRPLSLP